MSQTSYSINIPAVSYPGQMADNMEARDVLSAIAFLAAIVFGTLVVTDEANTTDFTNIAGKAPALTTDVSVVGTQLGVALAMQALPQNPAVANPSYPQGYAVSCLRKGRVWVNAETAMADGSNPFVRFTANGLLYPGNFRADADAGKAVQMAVGQAVMRGTTAAAGFAVLELDLV